MLTSRCALSHMLVKGPFQQPTFRQRQFLPLPCSPVFSSAFLRSNPLLAPSKLHSSLPLSHWLSVDTNYQIPLHLHRITAEAGSSAGATDSQARSNDHSNRSKSEGRAETGQATTSPPPRSPIPAAPLLVFGSDGTLQLSNSKPEAVVTEQLASPINSAKTAKQRKASKPNPNPSTKPVTKPAPEGEVSWKQGVPSRKDEKTKAKPSSSPKYSKAARRFYNERFRESERLSKVLAAAGVASRRACEELIFAGRVTVNGAVCTVPQTPVDLVKDNIYVDGRSLPKKLPPKLYFAVNKPKGYICSSVAENGKTAVSLVEEYMKVWRTRNKGIPAPRLFTVGRLDVATTGLLLITNDGGFAQSVAHPSSGVTKEYIATVAERVTRRQLAALENGIEIDGVMCTPVLVEIVEEGRTSNQGGHKDRLRIIVSEGKNREVRRLVEGAGLSIVSLKRVRIGGLRLPKDLGLGRYKVLDVSEAGKIASDPSID